MNFIKALNGNFENSKSKENKLTNSIILYPLVAEEINIHELAVCMEY